MRERAWRLAPVGLGAFAAVVYLWNLTVSGWANAYYSAAAQAASQSWPALFFGALDAAGFITVDKPPLSLWLMGLSVRLLGLSPFAVLLPQALAGVASVLVLHAAVRRQLGREAALIAGVAFAITPVAALMFRYNNPDAVLVLLLVSAAWAVIRGLEDGRLRWPLLAAVLVGSAFLVKYLQAYLVLPAFVLVWLVAAPGSVRRRIGVLLASGAVVVVSSAWWVAVVDLLPAGSRPYIGGSTNNTALELLLGYDGLGRLLGGFGPGGAPGPGPGGVPGGVRGGGPFGGPQGWLRMFNAEWGGQVSWLLPAAFAGLVVGLLERLRAPRTDARRAAYLLWGTWLIVHVVVFSLMGGIAHPYYAVAIAPAAAALSGGGIMELWRARNRSRRPVLVLGGIMVASACWHWQLLGRTPASWPGAGLAVLTIAVAAAILLAAGALADDPRAGRVARAGLALGLACILVGPALYTLETMGRPIFGGDPAAGPRQRGGFPSGAPASVPGAPGDLASDSALRAYLVANRGGADWLVAVSGANEAAGLQLVTGVPVMAMGGFLGSDPAPTADELRAFVRDGRLRFVIVGGGAGVPDFAGGRGGAVAAERSAWVTSACRPVTTQTMIVYDCAGAG